MSKLTHSDLRQFTGSEKYFRHALNRSVVYSEGAQYLAEQGGAHWLLDKIATLQLAPEIRRQEFQVWKLTVDDKSGAVLDCTDGNGNRVYSEVLTFTDFPLDQVELWFANGVIYLPSEH